jgi:hypothetical protein
MYFYFGALMYFRSGVDTEYKFGHRLPFDGSAHAPMRAIHNVYFHLTISAVVKALQLVDQNGR